MENEQLYASLNLNCSFKDFSFHTLSRAPHCIYDAETKESAEIL